MDSLMLTLQPIMEHVMANAVIYGVGAAVAGLIIFFTRPYSTAIILYAVEISIYLFSMHTVLHVIVKFAAWFSNQTTMKNVFDGNARDTVYWTTPWLHFWERETYDPFWLLWLEIVFGIIVFGLVWHFRPMKVQTKFKGSMAPDKQQSKNKVKKKGKKGKDDDDDDDGWGVATTRRFTVPDDVRASKWK